jgi:hypothetical protein
VRLREDRAPFQSFHIDNVAHEINPLRLNFGEKVEKVICMGGFVAEVNVGNPEGTIACCHY